MNAKSFLKPNWINIVITLIIPITIWYGTIYTFDYSVEGSIGKPNQIYQSWRIYPMPQIITIPSSISSWSQPVQRVINDNYIVNDIITIAASLIVNYLLSCTTIFFYSKLKSE